jgi:hypothetical protein
VIKRKRDKFPAAVQKAKALYEGKISVEKAAETLEETPPPLPKNATPANLPSRPTPPIPVPDKPLPEAPKLFPEVRKGASGRLEQVTDKDAGSQSPKKAPTPPPRTSSKAKTPPPVPQRPKPPIPKNETTVKSESPVAPPAPPKPSSQEPPVAPPAPPEPSKNINQDQQKNIGKSKSFNEQINERRGNLNKVTTDQKQQRKHDDNSLVGRLAQHMAGRRNAMHLDDENNDDSDDWD